MTDAGSGVEITGDEIVKLELTVDQVSFIVSGLRDCHDNLICRAHQYGITDEVEADYRKMAASNWELAKVLEAAMLVQTAR